MGWNVLEVIKYTATNTLKPQKHTLQMSELNGIWIKLNKLRFVCSGLKFIVIFPQPPKTTGVSHHLHLETLKALCRLGGLHAPPTSPALQTRD